MVVELGDVHYRAPEVSASEPAEMQGDPFALGALLHEMLAGTPGGMLPRDLPAPLLELLDGLASADVAGGRRRVADSLPLSFPRVGVTLRAGKGAEFA